MREIKFRVWNTGSDRMIYEPFMFQVTQEHDNEKSPFTYYEEWRDWEDGIKRPCEIMQFTGLKDKNGKEVYEGDIVKLKEVNRTYTVEFRDYCFKLVHTDERLRDHTGQLVWGSLERLDELGWSIEVIGNIHETQDLLK